MSEHANTESIPTPICNGKGWITQDGSLSTCRGCSACARGAKKPALEVVKDPAPASSATAPAAPAPPAAAPAPAVKEGGRCGAAGRLMELTDTEKKTRRTKCPDCGKKIVIKDDHFTPDFTSMKIPGHNREKGELVVKPVERIVERCTACNEVLTDQNKSVLKDKKTIYHVGCTKQQKVVLPTPDELRAEKKPEPIVVPVVEEVFDDTQYEKRVLHLEEGVFAQDNGPNPHDIYVEHYDRAPYPHDVEQEEREEEREKHELDYLAGNLGPYQAPDALPGQLAMEPVVPPEARSPVASQVEARVAHSIEEVEAAGGYTVIYADPPWAYDQGGRGAAKNHYPTMTIEQIKALPVSRLAAKDAVLFIWVTWPQMEVAFDVIRAWGFKFKTLGFSWVKYGESGKLQWGGGSWTRANEEVCLLATRGKPHRERADVHQLIEEWVPDEVLRAPRVEHSAKPAEARTRILKLMGDVPCIELFARERVEGFDAWGNDPALGTPDVLL